MRDLHGDAAIESTGADRRRSRPSAWPFVFIVMLYTICALLVDPRGEFPLNDDWSYTRSAFRLAAENRLQVDEWSAPTLIGQAFYGGLLAKLFGARFLVLRLSTLALSCAASCLIWTLLRGIGVPPGPAWISVLSWIFNPVWFCLSFTFMTEIPFLFFVTLASCLFAAWLRSEKAWNLLACGMAAGYAFLIRQTSVLFMAPMAAVLLFPGSGRTAWERIRSTVLWACGICIVFPPFAAWFLHRGGNTPAALRKFELLSRLTSKQLTGNSYGLAFYLCFFLLPVLICLLPSLGRSMRAWTKRSVGLAIAFWTLPAGYGAWWFGTRFPGTTYLPSRSLHARMPYLLNVLYDTGLGPLTLDPTYYGTPPTPTHPGAWLAVTVAVVLGFIVLGIMLVPGLVRLQGAEPGQSDNRLPSYAALATAGVAVFEVVFSHLEEGGLFDRHILAAALPLLLILMCTWGRAESGFRPRRIALAAASLVIMAAAWFSVCGTHDYLAWNRARWQLGSSLLRSKVDPLTVSGGFEFNGWHNYDAFRARGNIGKIYHWWYDRPDFVIAMEPQEGYRVLDRREYRSWLHRRDFPVYLLGR